MQCGACDIVACWNCHSQPEFFRERFGPPDHGEDIEVEDVEVEEGTGR